MKKSIRPYHALFTFLAFLTLNAAAQQHPVPERYQSLAPGNVKPMGWIKDQMRQDLQGFTGHLDELVPDLIQMDDIYGKNRLTRQVKSKDVGAQGDTGEWDVQFLWWNSETQSNWRDGFVRQAYLSGDRKAQRKAKIYIKEILATQDTDGYLGIYAPDLRYNLTGENGELWSKTTLYRVLLGYYEMTGDEAVWQALVRAVDNVMEHYPIHASSPFKAEKPFGGLSHGLVFTDVLDRMYQLTYNRKYQDYALFLYQDYCQNVVSETDVQIANILDDRYLMKGHGVHTYEHLRPLTVAYWASGDEQLRIALSRYLQRIGRLITPTGGPSGGEWITQPTADATHTGYEYCSIQEILDSYVTLFQKNGDPQLGDQIERIFFNAAQGARHPEKSCIAYLKTDNSLEMTGPKNWDGDTKQTRYKYSPVHQDAAVCCVPNAGRIAPYYVQAMWLKDSTGLVANLLGPCRLETKIGSNRIVIVEETAYPYENTFQFEIRAQHQFVLKIRKPEWVDAVTCSHSFQTDGAYLKIAVGAGRSSLRLEYTTSVRQRLFAEKERYFTYGALVYALPIASQEEQSKAFPVKGFFDFKYRPTTRVTFSIAPGAKARYEQGCIWINAVNNQSRMVEEIRLVPVGRTILRQVTF